MAAATSWASAYPWACPSASRASQVSTIKDSTGQGSWAVRTVEGEGRTASCIVPAFGTIAAVASASYTTTIVIRTLQDL